MRFSEILQGTRARQPTELPLAGAKFDPATAKWTGEVIPLDLRALLPEELADVQAKATAYAKKKGVEPEPGQSAYDIAIAIYTVHAAALEAKKEAPTPFFDVPAESLFTAEGVGLDAFAYLYERQQLWQTETAARPAFITPEELRAQLERMGDAGDELTFFFARLQPATRLTCLHIMASLLRSSLLPKSGSGIGSSSGTASTSAGPSKTRARKTRR